MDIDKDPYVGKLAKKFFEKEHRNISMEHNKFVMV